MGDLEWTNDLVIRLIQEYQRRPELWNPAHEMYRVQTLKYESWRELAAIFDCDVTDLRKKLNSLFASHRREKAKIRGGAKTNWFLYPYMSFLPKHIEQADDEIQQMSSPRSSSVKLRTRMRDESPPVTFVEEEDDEYQEVEQLDEQEAHAQQVHVKVEPEARTYQRPRRAPPAPPPPAGPRAHRLTRPIKRRVPTTTTFSNSLDGRLSEALKLLRRSELTRRKDECDSFGEYIADSLRKHDERTQAMIKQAINNIIFEQEMKKYGAGAHQQYAVVISGIDENPLILSDDGPDK